MDQDTLQLQPSAVGVYGWRKRCLYFFVLLLVALIAVNLGLTVWILVVLKFNIHGMGGLRITNEGLRLEGRAEFIDPLRVHTIITNQNVPLTIKSDKMVSLRAGGSEVELDPETISITSDLLQVHSQDHTADQPLLSISLNGMAVRSHELDVGSSLGVAVGEAASAALLSSHPDSSLKLRSLSEALTVTAERGVQLQAGFPARIEVSASDEISLSSEQIYLPGNLLSIHNAMLATPSEPPPTLPPSVDTDQQPKHTMMCMCATGEIYLVNADSTHGCSDDAGLCKSLQG